MEYWSEYSVIDGQARMFEWVRVRLWASVTGNDTVNYIVLLWLKSNLASIFVAATIVIHQTHHAIIFFFGLLLLMLLWWCHSYAIQWFCTIWTISTSIRSCFYFFCHLHFSVFRLCLYNVHNDNNNGIYAGLISKINVPFEIHLALLVNGGYEVIFTYITKYRMPQHLNQAICIAHKAAMIDMISKTNGQT